jgi:hypothetical protein
MGLLLQAEYGASFFFRLSVIICSSKMANCKKQIKKRKTTKIILCKKKL